MNLIDLHCDTAYKLYHGCNHLDENDGHISLNKATALTHYAQVMAIFTPKKYDDELGYTFYHRVADHFNDELQTFRARVAACYNADDIRKTWDEGKTAVLFAVEDARILGGVIERLDVLYARGVRFLTLVWGGRSCIGGAHDSGEGLTDFGKEVVRRCFALGIIPDLSHASDQVMHEVFELAREAGKPVMATHSNSRAVRDHKRNLTDEEFLAIKASGGIVGVSFCCPHLTDTSVAPADTSTVLSHIDHYLSLGGENTVCFGGDFDGIETTPKGLEDISRMPAMEQLMREHGYSDELIEKITYKNALNFIQKNIY